MLVPSPVIKRAAKDALKPRLMPAVIASCVLIFTFYILSFICSFISVFAGDIAFLIADAALSVFVFSPLALGLLNLLNRIVKEQDDSVLLIFKYFSSLKAYKRVLHFIWLMTLKLITSVAVLFFPCFIIFLLSSEALYKFLNISIPVWTSILAGLNSFIIILTFFALAFVMLKYYLSAFIFVSNDDIEPAEAINMSTIISKRTGGEFFGLTLSFIPWLLLSVLVAPLVFTLPYFFTSYAVHCHYAIAAYNQDVERFSAGYAPSFSTDEI